MRWVDPLGLVEPGAGWPKPPGWNENWQWRPGTRTDSGHHWWDPNGGEWRWDPDPHKYHPEFPEGHWDHNPWNTWNDGWQRIAPECPVKPSPPPPIPWWKTLLWHWPGPVPIIILPPGWEYIYMPRPPGDA